MDRDFFADDSIPRFCLFFLSSYVDSENYEKREKEGMPVLTVENYEAFPEEFEAYYNDHVPFRNQLIRFNNSLDYFLFKQSSSDQVAVGKEGWLFYCSDMDGNPLEQSLGYWHFTDDQLRIIADNLMSAKRTLENLGIEFVLFIAPNKETIYSEELPDYYPMRDSYTSTDQLVQYLKENTDIRVVYPKPELLEAKQEHPDIIFYHKWDSHWNYAGGYIGAQSLARELGVEMPPIEDVTLMPTESGDKDLADMLNVPLKHGSVDYDVAGINEELRETRKWDFFTEFDYHTPGGDSRRLLAYRDSYATTLAFHLSTRFENSLWIHQNNFDPQRIVDYGADIFVLERVERYLNTLEGFHLFLEEPEL